MTTLTKLMVRASLCLSILTFSGLTTVGDPEPVEWVPYTTGTHSYIGNQIGFAGRIHRYLMMERKLIGDQLKIEFNRWYATNLGHVFEEAALASYGIEKNSLMFNRRIPDGIEDGKLEQAVQYTDYPASTFIEAKCMSLLTLADPRISGQLRDMIDYLSMNDIHTTTKRFFDSGWVRMPGKASDEGSAVLLFLTPANTVIANDILQYANVRGVRVYQMKMECNSVDEVEIRLTPPEALTSPSLHFHGHVTHPFIMKMNWKRNIIDPDSGEPILGY